MLLGGMLMKVKRNLDEKQTNDSALPYYASMGVVFQIIDELRGGDKFVKNSDIYKSIRASKVTKIMSLKLCNFLGLVEQQGYNVRLTDLGYKISILSEEKRREELARTLPLAYVTILKWLKNSKSNTMTMDEIKASIVETFKWRPASRILKESILTFANVCKYCNILNIIKGSKGKSTRFELTEFGKTILGVGGSQQPNGEPTLDQNRIGRYNDIDGYRKLLDELITEKENLLLQTHYGTVSINLKTPEDWEKAESLVGAIKTLWLKDYNAQRNGEQKDKKEVTNEES